MIKFKRNKNLSSNKGMENLETSKENTVSKGYLMFKKEIPELNSLLIPQCELLLNNEDIMKFKVKYKTEKDSLWYPGVYEFSFQIPDDYPFISPKVHCNTKIYHPNIDFDGNVCLNILKEDWKPTLTIPAVIAGVYFLFYDPNPKDPLNHTAADLMREDSNKFINKVKKSLKGGNMDDEIYPKFI